MKKFIKSTLITTFLLASLSSTTIFADEIVADPSATIVTESGQITFSVDVN